MINEHTLIDAQSSLNKRLTVLIAVAVFVAGLQIFQAITRAWSVTRYEYTIVGPPDEELAAQLQTLGQAGWELISARRATNGAGERATAKYEMISNVLLELGHHRSQFHRVQDDDRSEA